MAIAKLVPTSLMVSMRFWRVLFLLMLVVLHFSAMRGAGDLWARALMLAHFGLFIIWQPFMRGERRLTAAQTFGMVAISVAILFFLIAATSDVLLPDFSETWVSRMVGPLLIIPSLACLIFTNRRRVHYFVMFFNLFLLIVSSYAINVRAL